ncbi:MAG TPA: caspase family protein, partial [Thermotogota bacterium]|nr:caspase family protein [Thermotogota bacterium]
MRKAMTVLFLFGIFLFSTALGAKTFALVVGVGEYDDPKIEALPGAVQDATQLAELFERLGIANRDDESLKLLLNPTQSQLLYETYSWSLKGQPGDRMIFYYGGHGETQITKEGTQTYLVPRDGYSLPALMAKTCLSFQEEIEPLLEANMQGKQTLLILDACYSGSILKSRPLSEPRFELSGFAALAKQRGIQVLVSAEENEQSQEKPGGGGYFTAALVEGLKGRANANGNETIEMGELAAYVGAEVRAYTQGDQNPVYFGTATEMVVVQDPGRTASSLREQVIVLYARKQIPAHHLLLYAQVLGQDPEDDNEAQARVRKNLEQYHQNRDLENLEILTQALLDRSEQPLVEEVSAPAIAIVQEPPVEPQNPEPQAQPQQPVQPAQPAGNCILQLLSGNQEIQGARIILDGND